jgi:hypothetical protein
MSANDPKRTHARSYRSEFLRFKTAIGRGEFVGNKRPTLDLFTCAEVVELGGYHFRELADHWFRRYGAMASWHHMDPYLTFRKIAPT